MITPRGHHTATLLRRRTGPPRRWRRPVRPARRAARTTLADRRDVRSGRPRPSRPSGRSSPSAPTTARPCCPMVASSSSVARTSDGDPHTTEVFDPETGRFSRARGRASDHHDRAWRRSSPTAASWRRASGRAARRSSIPAWPVLRPRSRRRRRRRAGAFTPGPDAGMHEPTRAGRPRRRPHPHRRRRRARRRATSFRRIEIFDPRQRTDSTRSRCAGQTQTYPMTRPAGRPRPVPLQRRREQHGELSSTRRPVTFEPAPGRDRRPSRTGNLRRRVRPRRRSPLVRRRARWPGSAVDPTTGATRAADPRDARTPRTSCALDDGRLLIAAAGSGRDARDRRPQHRAGPRRRISGSTARSASTADGSRWSRRDYDDLGRSAPERVSGDLRSARRAELAPVAATLPGGTIVVRRWPRLLAFGGWDGSASDAAVEIDTTHVDLDGRRADARSRSVATATGAAGRSRPRRRWRPPVAGPDGPRSRPVPSSSTRPSSPDPSAGVAGPLPSAR